MKYNEKSAAVLNSADRLEQIISWTLFTHEQDQRLWAGPTTKTLWNPGRPIYKHPYRGTFRTDMPEEVNYWTGDWGNWVRPMIEEIKDKEWQARCEPCGVWWDSEEPCWMCGEEREWMSITGPENVNPWFISPNDFEPIGYIEDSSAGELGFNIQFTVTNEQALAQMQAMWERMSGMFEETLSDATEAVNRFGRSIQSVMSTMDEFQIIHESVPVRPQVAGIELPENWMDVCQPIPLPEMPEPPDYSEWGLNGYRRYNRSNRDVR